MQIQIEEPGRLRSTGFALFALGFRPFFLLAGCGGAILLAAWAVVFGISLPLTTYYGVIGWHSHEMVFGYTLAVIAGFLLTAVRNWTGVQTPHGTKLAMLALLWLCGRLLPLFPSVLPGWLIALVDISFLIALAGVLLPPLVHQARGNRKINNLVFPLLLAALTAANLLVHLEVLGVTQATASLGVNIAVDLVILLIVIMGGRVIPFFTERAIPGMAARRWQVVDVLAPVSVIVVLAARMLPHNPLWLMLATTLAAVIQGLRLAGWYSRHIWSIPLLWVLHLGYGWMVIGFALQALAATGMVPPLLGTHAFTAGTIGVLTMGMMARVALGHSGRPLQINPLMTVAFVLINLAAAVRVLLPIAVPQWYANIIMLSGGLWALAFVLFVVIYAPILLRPRLDGRPG